MTAGGTYGTGGAAAGWYPDPQNPDAQRYWDGARWTEHTAPAGGPAPLGSSDGGSKKAMWAIVIVVGSLVLIVVIGIVASIAIPVFLSQRQKAADASAKADVSTLGKEIATWYVDNDGPPPAISVNGGRYFLDDLDIGPVATNVELGGQTGSGANDWCVWVTNPQGDFKDFEYSAEWGLGQGTC